MNYLISKTLEEDPILRMGYERKLISAGTLAKHIVIQNPERELHPESVRTAIRRLKRPKRNDSNLLEKAEKILADSALHVRSNMVKIEFVKDESTLQLINKSFKINELYNNDLFRLIKGHSVLHAIVEEANMDKILNLFEGKVMATHKGLCEFIIAMPFNGRDTPGVLLTLTNELSLNSINIVQAFSCGEEINIIVDDKDNQKAYNLLTNLFKRAKINTEGFEILDSKAS
ncbi:hypothetical protein GOV05_01325 [Candidatus Woesearchaeota archaeon]|nr:hypothetical protein [Candidatus Woesearchaeota archaeon]